MTRRLLLAAIVALVACKARREAGGVVVESRADGLFLRGGAVQAVVTGKEEKTTRIVLAPFQDRPPITFEARVGERALSVQSREVATVDGVAAVRHVLEGEDATLVVTIDPGIPAIVVRAHGRVGPMEKLSIVAKTAKKGLDVALDRGGPWSALPRTPSAFAVLGSDLLFVGSRGLEVEANDDVVATASAAAASSSGADVTMTIAAPKSLPEALSVGARLGGVPAHGSELLVTAVDAATKQPIGARLVLLNKDAPKEHVWDVRRDAERTMPVVDVVGRTVVSLATGKHTLLLTRGMGWSIARAEIDASTPDARKLELALSEETPHPDWIGCDFHVHAKLSFDATTVTYEDRVRSLAAVGIECAAATEHDHVGDHGPAAHELGLDDVFRALKGVELTTVSPGFGHFNVYPWPEGATIPETRATKPDPLFDAVHALPGSFILQVNHPRMVNADKSKIGYFDFVGLDPYTGKASERYYKYRRDYDALEVFNGYELHDLNKVEATIDEWLRMLDRGEVHVATGSSDSHGITMPWAGFPRTMVRVGDAWRHEGRPIQAIVDAIKKGRVYVTSGPLVELHLGDATLGDEAHGGTVKLEVAATSWLAPPKAKLRLGAEVLAEVPLVLDASGKTWSGTFVAPAVTRKRPLVALVEADVVGDAVSVTGLPRTLAVTNPIWLVP